MREYIYQALTENDQPESGRMTAANAAAAVAMLEARGLAVQMIRQVTAADESAADQEWDEPLLLPDENEDDIIRDRVAQMLQSRDTLAPALIAFAEEMPAGRPRRELKRLATSLNSGATVEQLCRTPEMAAAWIPLVNSGTALGSTSFLHDLFTEAARDNALRTQRARVLTYPLVVFTLAMTVLILLCLVVGPTFASMFEDFDLELPTITKIVVELTTDLQSKPLLVFLTLVIFVVLFYAVIYLLTSSGLTGQIFGALTKGSSRQVTTMANFIRRLAESLQGGLTLPASLRLAGRASGKGGLNREAHSLAEKIESPQQRPWSSKFPPTLLLALRSGPRGTPNLRLLQELAEMYAERVHARFDWSTGFVPQLAILVVGIVVGFVVLALFLPLVELVNGLSS